ncbi:ABC transporter permease [Rhizomonospora bruguierae]|uniref:ABC transporter permease n=1 Tax=Rhizomonospora bruguierae TaxID=1581705 RepID=UPI001BD0FAF8|nr:FtsX-like permease family protein [Micromonospora sp. NBRC 107566]
MRPRIGTLLTISARQLRTRLGRSALAGISLVIGVLAITAIEATAGAARQIIINQSELTTGRAGTAWASVRGGPLGTQATLDGVNDPISPDRADGTAVAAIGRDTGATIDAGGRRVGLIAYAGALRTIRPWDTVAGGWPSTEAIVVPEILVNEEAARQLTTGQPLRLSVAKGDVGTPVRVRGTVRDGEFEARAYMPWQALAAHAGSSQSTTITLLVRDGSGRPTDSVARLDALASRHQIPLDGAVEPVRSDPGLGGTLRTIRIGFLIVGVITVLVGVMGMLNIGLATIRERAEELALRRSLGATRRDIALLVLFEAVLVGLAGAVSAVAIAAGLFAPLAARLFPADSRPAFPLGAALIGIAVGALAGLLGGLIPAIRAARLPIAAVMRA